MITLTKSEFETLLELHDDVGDMQARIEAGEVPVLLGREGVSVMDMHLNTEALWELGVMCIAASLLNGKSIERDDFSSSQKVHAVLNTEPLPAPKKQTHRRSRLALSK